MRVSALIALWDEGLPTSEIGRRLGVSKNAVIGKIHRLGLSNRKSPVQKKPQKAAIIGMESLTTGMCNWPDGDPGTDGFNFCGRPTLQEKPYCADHCARAYITGSREKSQPRTARAA